MHKRGHQPVLIGFAWKLLWAVLVVIKCRATSGAANDSDDALMGESAKGKQEEVEKEGAMD